jgi:O-antigen/teichoic acid export membrane protein
VDPFRTPGEATISQATTKPTAIRRRLPAVTQQIGAVAAGLMVLGLASFAFLSISGRALGPAGFAPLATLWVILNAAGPAFFQPLEQELGRAIAHRRARGQGGRGLFLRGCMIAGALVMLIGVALLVFSEPLADAVFTGEQSLVLALVVGLAGLGAEHLTRGAFAGTEAFTRYGWQLGLDGVLRLVGSGMLALMGIETVGWYGFAVAAAPVIAVIATMWRLGPATEPSSVEHSWGELLRALAVLMVGTAMAQFVVNAAPVAASILAGPEEAARAGVFISVLVLSRIPLFLFSAIQASFLPGLATLVAQGDSVGFRRRLTSVLGVVTGLAVAGLLIFVVLGPWLVTLFYGAEYQTTRTDIWPLAAGAGLFMIASALAQTLIALRAYLAAVLGWVLGSVAFLVAIAVPLRLEQRVGLAFLVATAVAAAWSAVAMARRLTRPIGEEPDSVPLAPSS